MALLRAQRAVEKFRRSARNPRRFTASEVRRKRRPRRYLQRPLGMHHAQASLRRSTPMLYTIAVVLLILWLLGLVSGYTIGAFIHVLLVIAVVLFVVALVSGRRVV